ncbi:Rab proteins geranylgeranyltransferase component A [Pleurotus pulmonarius]|nr:Rab proteins geranylgeranyltransferase component A [Pleurotus pulmonarius]KAF4600545.1 Rab proteins geranylgeranyltransferase component A [Pleurotus pulmonarius]
MTSASEEEFDVILLGTGLTESITAAALAKAGVKVAQIDTNPYYGAENASLSLDELIQWADEQNSTSPQERYSSISYSPGSIADSRRYSISLSPAVIPSIGPHITSLVASGVAKYGGFKLLQNISIYSSGKLRTVPGSKEDIFKSTEITLLEKRRVMRFLMFAASEFEEKPEFQGKKDLPFSEFLDSAFSLSSAMSTVICFALAYCFHPSDSTPNALSRIRRYLRSHGRYGPSSFIIGQYGGAGEIAQGFCRTAAVHGGVYILGRSIRSITPIPSLDAPSDHPEQNAQAPSYDVTLNDFPEHLISRVLISSPLLAPEDLRGSAEYIPLDQSYDHAHFGLTVARCIAIIDQPIIFASAPAAADEEDTEDLEGPKARQPDPSDVASIIFPPSTLENGSDSAAATVIVMGAGTMSTPEGKWIVYIMLPVPENTRLSSEDVLQPYLSHILTLTSVPDSGDQSDHGSSHLLFKLFYLEHNDPPQSPTAPCTSSSSFFITPPSTQHPAEIFDCATSSAETTFWRTIRALQSTRVLQLNNGDDGCATLEVDSFWPPLDRDAEEEEEEEW